MEDVELRESEEKGKKVPPWYLFIFINKIIVILFPSSTIIFILPE